MLTYGMVNSAVPTKVRDGYAFYVPRENDGLDATRHDAYAHMAWELGYVAEPPAGPPYLPAPTRIDHIKVIRQAIEAQEISNAFIQSWGTIQRIFTLYNCLCALEPDIDDLLQSFKGGVPQSIEIQKYWFVHWINENAPPESGRDPDLAINDFEDLCIDIARGRLKPWGPYPKDWYLRIVSTPRQRKRGDLIDANANLELSQRLRRLSRAEREKMLEHPLITRDVLPPLSADEFENTQ